MKKPIRILVGFAVTTLFVLLIERQIDIAGLFSIIGDTNLLYLLAAVFLFLIGCTFRIERWRIILLHENPSISWKECAGPLMASIAVNNVAPLRSGDIVRAFAFNQKLKISSSTSFASIIVERLLDLLIIVTFTAISLNYVDLESTDLILFGYSTLFFSWITILALLLFPNTLKPSLMLLGRVVYCLHPKFGISLTDKFSKFLYSLALILTNKSIAKLLVLSLLVWVSEGLVFYLVSLSIPTIENKLAAFIALPISTFATLIPSAPGNVGTFDYFAAQTMIIMGNSSADSFAFAFITHAVLWLPPIVIVGFYLLNIPINNCEARTKTTDENS